MGRPYALLRVGFSYDKTLGMRRLTNTPVDLAVDSSGDLFILCRGGAAFSGIFRRTTMTWEPSISARAARPRSVERTL